MTTPSLPRPTRHCEVCQAIQQWDVCHECRKKQSAERYQRNIQAERKRADDNKYYRSNAWRKLRDWVVERDYKQCVACSSGKRLTVHHVTPRRAGGLDHPSNLVTLCHICHNKIEAGSKKHVEIVEAVRKFQS